MEIQSNHLQNLKLLSRSEAAGYLCIGKSALNNLIEEGRIPIIMLGKRIKIPLKELSRFIDENSTTLSNPSHNQQYPKNICSDSTELLENLIMENL